MLFKLSKLNKKDLHIFFWISTFSIAGLFVFLYLDGFFSVAPRLPVASDNIEKTGPVACRSAVDNRRLRVMSVSYSSREPAGTVGVDINVCTGQATYTETGGFDEPASIRYDFTSVELAAVTDELVRWDFWDLADRLAGTDDPPGGADYSLAVKYAPAGANKAAVDTRRVNCYEYNCSEGFLVIRRLLLKPWSGQ